VLYPPILLYMNNKKLAHVARPGLNSALVILCSLFYLSVIIYTIFNLNFR
jgi:hypothetical protein